MDQAARVDLVDLVDRAVVLVAVRAAPLDRVDLVEFQVDLVQAIC